LNGTLGIFIVRCGAEIVHRLSRFNIFLVINISLSLASNEILLSLPNAERQICFVEVSIDSPNSSAAFLVLSLMGVKQKRI
jgi:hypothetical protein